MRLKKFSVIIQGEILNRNTLNKDQFFTTCRTKQDFISELGRIYNTLQENPELTITTMIRRAK